MEYKCCFYGSLRPPMYNWKRFVDFYGPKAMVHLGTTEIKGFKLYSLGAYPAAVKSDDDSQLIVDLFELDHEVYNHIHGMEYGAGYTREVVNIDGDKYSIFVYPDSGFSVNNLVKSGDWVAHILSKEKNKS